MGECEKQVVVLCWGSLCRGRSAVCARARCLYALIPEGMGESEAFMSCLGRLASYVVYLAI